VNFTLATSKNLTLKGTAGILFALASVLWAIVDGNPATNPDWGLTVALISTSVTDIMAKGAKSTGGTVPETPEAIDRVPLKPPP
jgi:hypothetical protein